MYVLSISSPSLRVSPRFLRVSLVSLVFSSLRVSLVCLSLRLSASFRLSRLLVCSSFQSFHLSRLFSLSSFHLSRLFVSLIFSSLRLVPVDRLLPSPWLGSSRLRGSATPVPGSKQRPCLKQPPMS